MTRTTRSGRIAAVIAVATAILVAAPVISIIALAMQPAPDVWQTLIKYVLPRSLLDTALLLIGVGSLSLAIGTGAAWAVSLHEFRGRQMLLWLLPLPLAIPTYLAAYVYVDLFEPLGLVHKTLTVWLPLQDAVRLLPNLRSLPGAVIVIALVLYPYVYLSARTMFQFQSAEFAEAAKTLGAGRWTTFWRITLPMVMPFIILALLFRTIENFKMFDLVDQLTNGGPGSVTELASIKLKREAFEKWRTGYASALAIIMFVSIYGLSLVAVRFLEKVKQR